MLNAPEPKNNPSNTSRNWSAGFEEFAGLRAIVLRPPAVEDLETVTNDEWIVLCHGYGASAEDLFGLADPLVKLFDTQSRRPLMVFPEAPIDMQDFGMSGGRAWWPLNMEKLLAMAQSNNFSAIRNEVPPGLNESREVLVKAIHAMADEFRLSTKRLILGGFSQGAMLATDTAIRGLVDTPDRLALFSGAMICESLWRANSGSLKNTTVFQSHGRQDPVLPFQTGRWLGDFMSEHANKATFQEFEGGHWIPPEALKAFANL